MMKRISLYFFLVALCTGTAVAQDDLDKLLQNSVEDGRLLVQSYVDPFMKSVSLGLNQGWYNTAKPHKLFGVDLTITASAMTIPSSDLFYDVAKLNLQEIEMDPSSPDYTADKSLAPTILGPDRSPIYRLQDDPSVTYEGPGGLDLKDNIGKNWMPVPMVTLGFGLPKETDLKLRFTPAVDVGDNGTVQLLGIGVMHNVKQYIPGLKLLPFDLSGFVGYTRLKLEYNHDEEEVGGENQRSEFVMSATTVQGLISKKFSVLTVYGGLGYNIAKSNIAMKGTYDFDEDGVIDPQETNPVDLKFSASGPRFTAGFRVKLAVITLHADYTLQKYNALTVGFGINVR